MCFFHNIWKMSQFQKPYDRFEINMKQQTRIAKREKKVRWRFATHETSSTFASLTHTLKMFSFLHLFHGVLLGIKQSSTWRIQCICRWTIKLKVKTKIAAKTHTHIYSILYKYIHKTYLTTCYLRWCHASMMSSAKVYLNNDIQWWYSCSNKHRLHRL